MSDEKWISKDYIVAWAATFLLSTSFYLFMVTTSGFAISTFGVSPALAGLSTSIAVLAAIIARLVVGNLPHPSPTTLSTPILLILSTAFLY